MLLLSIVGNTTRLQNFQFRSVGSRCVGYVFLTLLSLSLFYTLFAIVQVFIDTLLYFIHYLIIDRIKYLMHITIICIENVPLLGYNLSGPDDDRFWSEHVVHY
jgi:hypothetical protein